MVSCDVASIVCQALGCGVTRSKRRALSWTRKAAENGIADACLRLAGRMYLDLPYAREVGHVMEADGDATSTGVMQGHNVPRDVLTGVVHWLRKGRHNTVDMLDAFRRTALREGGQHCRNDGCEVEGLLKDFKVCRSARPSGTAAPRARKWTGPPVGTGRRVASTVVNEIKEWLPATGSTCYIAIATRVEMAAEPTHEARNEYLHNHTTTSTRLTHIHRHSLCENTRYRARGPMRRRVRVRPLLRQVLPLDMHHASRLLVAVGPACRIPLCSYMHLYLWICPCIPSAVLPICPYPHSASLVWAVQLPLCTF